MNKERPELENFQIVGLEDEGVVIEECMDKYGKIQPYMPEAIRHLPMPLQQAILAFLDGKYPDENGVLQEMGGYDDDCDSLLCLLEIEVCIVTYSQTRQTLEAALRFIGHKEDHIRQYDQLFDLNGEKMPDPWP